MANSKKKKARRRAKERSSPDSKKRLFTEADVEARIVVIFRKVFPWLDPSGLQFQKTFQFTLGRAHINVDGKKVSRAHGRADVVVTHNQIPIAIFELKRPGWRLTEEDFTQGQSYAKFLNPPPPLVIVSNGEDTWIRTSHNGEEWSAGDSSEQRLASTIKAALRITAAQQRNAIDALMGPGSDVWTQGVSTATDCALAELTGGWNEELLPLVSDFLIRREATEAIRRALLRGKKVVLLFGGPLSGKTNVLRQLATEAKSSADFALLYVDLTTSAFSVFRAIAYLLDAALGWPATDDEARQWVLRLSHRTDGPTLLLALDGVYSGNRKLVEEFNELASTTFGPKLRIVATANAGDEQQLLTGPDHRTPTRVGRGAAVVRLKPLSDSEFDGMTSLLAKHKVHLLAGAERSLEWRQPWIVRALVAQHTPSAALEGEDIVSLAPPFLGVALLQQATVRFSSEVRSIYGQLAKAVLDAAAAPSSTADRLDLLFQFAISSELMRGRLSESEMREMSAGGYLSTEYLGAGRSRVVPKLQELLAAEIAAQMADELVARSSEDPPGAAKWLIRLGSNLPFGALISAAALLDAGSRTEGLSAAIIEELVNTPPRLQRARVGTRFATVLPGGLVEVTVLEGGKLRLSANGRTPLIVDAEDEGESPRMIADSFPWLALSYLASTRMEMYSEEHAVRVRGDYGLLLQLGSCPIILTGADGWDRRGHYSHWIDGQGEVLCHKSGIIEPITESMRLAILRDGSDSDAWIVEASRSNSAPLLMRVLTALRSCEGVAHAALQAWVDRRVSEISQRVDQLHVFHH